jgi:hypothetical protein
MLVQNHNNNTLDRRRDLAVVLMRTYIVSSERLKIHSNQSFHFDSHQKNQRFQAFDVHHNRFQCLLVALKIRMNRFHPSDLSLPYELQADEIMIYKDIYDSYQRD